MGTISVDPNTKTYIPWCCEEFADSGATMGEDSLVGSLAGTYLVTCTIPYAIDSGSGEVVGEVELSDGFGNLVQSITMDRKISAEDTLVMSSIVIAPESALFAASVTHTFAGTLTVYAESHMEICMLAPTSEVAVCSGWTISASGFNTNCDDPASDLYTMLAADTLASFTIEFIDGYNYVGVPGEAQIYVNGVIVATMVIPLLSSPFVYTATEAIDIPVSPGDTVGFDLSTGFNGDMTFSVSLPGGGENALVSWVACT